MKTIRSNKKGFGIHSPFVYNLITNVLFPAADYYVFEEIEKLNESRKEKAQLKMIFRLLNYFQPDLVDYNKGVFTKEGLNILKTFSYATVFKEIDSDFIELLKNQNRNFIIINKLAEFEIQSFTGHGVCFLKNELDRNNITFVSEYLNEKRNGIILIELKNEDLIIFDKRFLSQHYVIK